MPPLQGVFVVAVEQAVAAPFCTARLADAGATVVKIERPEGDFARGYDDAAKGLSSYFVWLNRGKQSVALDRTEESDRAELVALIARADILVQNLKPGAVDRLMPTRLCRHMPRDRGPRRPRPMRPRQALARRSSFAASAKGGSRAVNQD